MRIIIEWDNHAVRIEGLSVVKAGYLGRTFGFTYPELAKKWNIVCYGPNDVDFKATYRVAQVSHHAIGWESAHQIADLINAGPPKPPNHCNTCTCKTDCCV